MTSYSDTLQRGDKISCYQIEEVLGRGGFAVTYLAVDLNLDVHVAIKEFLPREIIQRDDQLQVTPRRAEFQEDYDVGLSNFAREAKTLAQFKHLNIVRVHQVIHQNNTAYIVMDFEHGRELTEVLEEQQTLSEEQLRETLFPIFDGVEEIHSHGLAHRDIKPSNIYLRDNGSPVLLDFGAARYTMSETTQQLTAVVTVGYTPIEQYNVSDDDQGPWSDIYALAAVLYEAVSGKMPVDSVTRASSRLTNTSDPLTPIANKARQHYSDEFLNAIDWGLKMDAKDRPQTIAQWRDAFNGVAKPAEEYKQKIRPARKSKLKTRARDHGTSTQITRPAAAPERPTQTPAKPGFMQSRELYRPDSVVLDNDVQPELDADIRDTRFDPNDVEIVTLNPDATPLRRTGASRPASGSATVHSLPNSPFASNPAQQDATQPHRFTKSPSRVASANQPTHTQELRKVLRRDIVKRDNSPRDETPAPPPLQAPDRNPAAHSAANGPSINAQQPPDRFEYRPAAPRGSIARDDFEFDDSDWDYEAPETSSKWKWVATLVGLGGIAGAALLFVNKPDLFNFAKPGGPEMTIATALDKAQQKVQNNQLIFPAGESALDYYQLILDSEPDNSAALGGVASIRGEIKQRIIEHVDNENLGEANKLLSRANQANLQIEGLNSTDTVVSITPAIDTTASPWLERQIEDIEALIDAGDLTSAQALFNDVDKYIADASVSNSIRRRLKTGNDVTLPKLEQPTTENSQDATTVTQDTTDSVTAIEEETVVSENVTAEPVEQAQPRQPATQAVPESLPVAIPESEQKIAVIDEPETLPSAPRRSFIEGNDATAQHLNQLRLAIEAKNLQRVLQVSDTLPEERTEFLRRLFQRYDRLDVTIDNIERGASQATAKLSVSMFNQRSDGSYYSAGTWNDVRLTTTNNGQWQPIKW